MKNEIYYQLIIYNFRYKFIKNDAYIYILYINYDKFRGFNFKYTFKEKYLKKSL